MTLAEAIERRNKLQTAFDALLMGDRVVDIKFEDHSVSYHQGSAKILQAELLKAIALVNKLTGSIRKRPHLIKHKSGY